MGRGQGDHNGTGQPIVFMCFRARQKKDWRTGYVPRGHTVVRTGRTRYVGKGGQRMDVYRHEYRCACGHVGWTKHKDILRYPIEEKV